MYVIYTDMYLSTAVRSAGTSRLSGELETLNASRKTDERLHITRTQYCT